MDEVLHLSSRQLDDRLDVTERLEGLGLQALDDLVAFVDPGLASQVQHLAHAHRFREPIGLEQGLHDLARDVFDLRHVPAPKRG